MVAMVLFFGTQITVSPADGPNRHFDFGVAGDKNEAVKFIKRLKSRTSPKGSTGKKNKTKDVTCVRCLL
jgi:hypothetical protein